MSGSTDAELWRLAVAGEAAAFGVLFERHAATIYNYCFRRTGDWSLAEDLASTVFLEAWRRRADVRLERDSALPWLLGVATNVLRNRWRSERRHRAALARLSVEREDGFEGELIDRIDDQREMRRVLRTVAALSRDDQDVLALCVWEGLSYESTALALGVPVGTVRSRLSRARAAAGTLGGRRTRTNDDGTFPRQELRACAAISSFPLAVTFRPDGSRRAKSTW